MSKKLYCSKCKTYRKPHNPDRVDCSKCHRIFDKYQHSKQKLTHIPNDSALLINPIYFDIIRFCISFKPLKIIDFFHYTNTQGKKYLCGTITKYLGILREYGIVYEKNRYKEKYAVNIRSVTRLFLEYISKHSKSSKPYKFKSKTTYVLLDNILKNSLKSNYKYSKKKGEYQLNYLYELKNLQDFFGYMLQVLREYHIQIIDEDILNYNFPDKNRKDFVDFFDFLAYVGQLFFQKENNIDIVYQYFGLRPKKL